MRWFTLADTRAGVAGQAFSGWRHLAVVISTNWLGAPGTVRGPWWKSRLRHYAIVNFSLYE
jgi:hypothetical protein